MTKNRSSFPIEVINWHDENTREPYAYYDLLTAALTGQDPLPVEQTVLA